MKKIFLLLFLTTTYNIFSSEADEGALAGFSGAATHSEDDSIESALAGLKEFVEKNPVLQPIGQLITTESATSRKQKEHVNLIKAALFRTLLDALEASNKERPDLPQNILKAIQEAYKAGIINSYNPTRELAHCTKPGLLHAVAASSNSAVMKAFMITGAQGTNHYNSELKTPAHLLALRVAMQEDAVTSLQLLAPFIDPRTRDQQGRTVINLLKHSIEVRIAADKSSKDIQSIIQSIKKQNAQVKSHASTQPIVTCTSSEQGGSTSISGALIGFLGGAASAVGGAASVAASAFGGAAAVLRPKR
jgi:hypothetical protein